MTQQTDGNDQAFPKHPYSYSDSGLTKREYFAAMAMQGICANSSLAERSSYNSFAEWSVQQADALIEALNKEK
jgi:hypothetical protein